MNSNSPWLKATASNQSGNCVQLRSHDGVPEVRDSKHPEARSSHSPGPRRDLAHRRPQRRTRPPRHGDLGLRAARPSSSIKAGYAPCG